jgi:hypothetical protein
MQVEFDRQPTETGACLSPDPSNKENAKVWLSCIEEVLFRDDDFCAELQPSTPGLPTKAKLQALQASYMVCMIQNWEGDDSAKRRIRRYRYSTVIAVSDPQTLVGADLTEQTARDIGIAKARHLTYSSDFNWYDFVAREELIR